MTDILNKSIEFLRTGDNKEDIDSIEIEINKSCLITQDYINDILTRLKYYKKISSCKNLNEITYISDELIDIYGPMPEFLENLLHISKLKLTLKDKNIKHIKIVDGIAKIEFKDKDNISVEKIIANMSQYEMKILKNSSIQLSLDNEDTADICQKIENLIKSIF